MTENDSKRRSEVTFIGFQKEPKGLAELLQEKKYEEYTLRRDNPSLQRKRYKHTDPSTGGHVYVLYQQGKEINPEYKHGKEENIKAIIRVGINLGLLLGMPDTSLQQKRDDIVTLLLDTYKDNAFLYEPQSAAAKKQTA